MAALTWHDLGQKTVETGTDKAVLYSYDAETSAYTAGVAWSGITAFTESPSGAESTALYADNIKYLSLRAAEEFGFTIEAYVYPEEFGKHDGTYSPVAGLTVGQQNRRPFGFAVRTLIANDTEGMDHGYKIHLVYGAEANPSEKAYTTVNESPEAVTFSWECTTTPISVAATDEAGKPLKPIAHIEIDSRNVAAAKLTALEKVLYGDDTTEPKLPLPDEVISMLSAG